MESTQVTDNMGELFEKLQELADEDSEYMSTGSNEVDTVELLHRESLMHEWADNVQKQLNQRQDTVVPGETEMPAVNKDKVEIQEDILNDLMRVMAEDFTAEQIRRPRKCSQTNGQSTRQQACRILDQNFVSVYNQWVADGKLQ